jgi:hypothetical protein
VKTLSILLIALFALAGFGVVAPVASAQPCTMTGCCPPPTMCPCLACGIPPIVIQCSPPQTVSAAPWASVTVSDCGSSGYVCTDPAYRIPTDPHSQGGLYCGA